MKKAVMLALMLLVSCSKSEQPAANATTPATASTAAGNATHGKELVLQYGCTGCHVVPGMGAGGNLGPSLEHFGSRGTIVQKFPNNPQNLTQWIMSPQSMDPNTTMPPSGMNESDARDTAAFLLSQK